MRIGRVIALLTTAAVGVAACGGDLAVTVERSDRLRTQPVTIDEPVTTDPNLPGGTEPAPTTPPPRPATPVDPTAIDFGANKPAHPNDDFLLAVMTDIEQWWTEQYPAVYGEAFRPLEGSVYAAHPGRPDDIPGCGSPRTTYAEVQEYVAFYCAVGDFIVYDSGEDGLLAELSADYGAGTIGTVLAHEFGHAIQLRSGALDRALPTVVTEQQADCFAGAWTSRAANDDAATVRYSDDDVRAGLIAMTKVSDPVGLDQFVAGGHGSAFDRIGAFQEGYLLGAARCAELLDDPLPLVPNEFTTFDEQRTGGNAPFGYGDEELIGFIPEDLNLYWGQQVTSEVPRFQELELVVIRSASDADCTDLRGDITQGAALCASTNQVYFNEPVALELYRAFGDFSVGYVLGSAWSEAAQIALRTGLEGEPRALLNDCLTGAWVKTVVPVDYRLPLPRPEERTVSASAGDLDEAIQTVLLVADESVDDNEVGSAFEKIDAFRRGVLGGLDACL
jgi:predicted metalloprotease